MSNGNVGGLGSVATRLYQRFKNGNVSYVGTYYRTNTDTRQIWDGSEMANFYKRRKAGELLPFGSYRKFAGVSIANNSNWSTRYVSGSTVDTLSYYDNGHPGLMPLLEEDDLEYMLSSFDAKPYVQAAAAKIASSGFDLLTFVAELHQIHSLWRETGKMLAKILDGRKGSVANTWLNARYGWRMIYYEFVNIQKLIQSLDKKRIRVKERVGRDVTRTNVTHVVTPKSYGTVYWSYEDRMTCGLRGLVSADIDVPPFSVNPFVTAWELCRYSFVIDWFFQVGQWINTMSFLSAESAHVACQSYGLTVERTVSLDSIQLSAGWSCPSQVLDQKHVARLLVRVPTSIPLGVQTTLKLDPLKVIDLMSLVLQLLKVRF